MTNSASESPTGSSSVQVIVTSDQNGIRSCPSTFIGPVAKAPEPRHRLFTRRTSHTLLFVPEQRRVSTISGNSITSCPTEFSEDSDDTRITTTSGTIGRNHVKHPTAPGGTSLLQGSPIHESSHLTTSCASDILRRKSVQTGAPVIGFRPKRTFERRASQPTISVNLINMNSNGRRILESQHQQIPIPRMAITSGLPPGVLAKRVSWMSMKSLQDCAEPLLEIRKRNGDDVPKSDSRTNSQLGSVIQLNDTFDLESDTPPMDTLSWSNAGAY